MNLHGNGTDMKIRCPGKTKKKRFGKLKSLERDRSYRLFLNAQEYIKPHDFEEEDDYEAEDEEFEDYEEGTDTALGLEFAGEIW